MVKDWDHYSKLIGKQTELEKILKTELQPFVEEVEECRRQLRVLEDIKDKEEKRVKKKLGLGFYVYLVFVDAEIRYVGKGSGDRYKHSYSGASNVVNLNRDHFEGKYIEVRMYGENMSESLAEIMETELIMNLSLDTGGGWVGGRHVKKDSVKAGWDFGCLYNRTLNLPNKEYRESTMDFCPWYFSSSIRGAHNNGCPKIRDKFERDMEDVVW